MLKQRIITGVVLVSAFLCAIAFLPLFWLAVVFGLVVSMGAWEWSRLAGWESWLLRFLYVGVLIGLVSVAYLYVPLDTAPLAKDVQPFLGLACLWWSIALLWVKGFPTSAALWGSKLMRSLMGFIILAPAWIASVFLLSFPKGSSLMVAMILVVVCADIGAYFSGKRFGRHKLAPAVSPAKTWEGFWGGILACAILSVVVWYFLPVQQQHIGLASVAGVILTTAAASVVGDLSVSMVKRQGGFKDSGNLLPGHGGILDRLDSIVAAAPVFALGLLLVGW
ncbi:MAG: phosphatidate cytidylyltransferase [Halioglobus sp.]|jgi:phosphatidate cytidylyltransferase